jgi:elongation factor G
VLCLPDAHGPLRALAFKALHCPQRGPLTLVRVYSGTLEAGSVLVNATRGGKERVSRVLRVSGGDTDEVPRVTCGNIAALVGPREARTGDTLCGKDSGKSAKKERAKRAKRAQQTGNTRKGKPADGEASDEPTFWGPVVLEGMAPPPPVFTAALEVESAAQEQSLRRALERLQREDPSIHVSDDEASGQTLVAGMGELHLEVVMDRLRREFRQTVYQSRVRVAYRESVSAASEGVFEHDQTVGEKRSFARATVRVEPLPWVGGPTEGATLKSTNSLLSPRTQTVPSRGDPAGDGEGSGLFEDVDGNELPATGRGVRIPADAGAACGAQGADPHRQKGGVAPSVLAEAALEGIRDAMGVGPLLGYSLVGLRVTPVSCGWSADTTPAAMRACAMGAVAAAARDAAPLLMEPAMAVEVEAAPHVVGAVLSDLSAQRRGEIRDTVVGDGSEAGATPGAASVRALVPLAEMVGYSSHFRSLTGGEASFSMTFDSYRPVPEALTRQFLQSPP